MQAEKQADDLFEKKEIFGGALEIELPKRFIDISNFREVPDNQEIFADSANTDQSFIIELLDMSDDVADKDVARYLFNDLCNLHAVPPEQCIVFTVLDFTDVDNPNFVGHWKQGLVGQQRVAKHNDPQEYANVVNFYMGVVRLKNVHTDLLVTFNDPVMIHPHSSSASSDAVGSRTDVSMSMFKRAFASLAVRDWGIFNA